MTPHKTMKAMVTMGHGDLDQMVLHRDWPRPDPVPGEVLIRVRACGLNNTDVNTRSGWYSKAVTEATTGGAPIRFPRIQGADVCGEIAAGGSVLADTEALHLATTIPDENCHAVWACQDMITLDIAGGRGPRNSGGYLHLSETPGLGVHPDEYALGTPVATYL
ncbi:Alcohol dehydrogenase GroES-like domain-containing protein [Roseovarius lutimaris]|uniref:Alcohol dehydrogenase GroES-like domain-containing protein n=1 Tax=Roseovarius lutimaris TaxID=1005928 RepID=A0A1I5F5C1_9RHOB|nr:alcohol dehydrogenase catalytic domain-containing protein [Roseovarius lutimaris]SFO18917.1 Alcohol dehydrogenase GroES-like domain-containing protein [Roseovarius lutimaris]